MSNKKEFVTLPSAIPHKKTIVKAKLTGKEKFVLNDQLYILGFEGSKTRQTEIIVGDRVSKVNGIQMKAKAEVIAALAVPGEVSLLEAEPIQLDKMFTLELLRRSNAKPIPKERFAKVLPNGEDGFGYFIVDCMKTPTDTGNSFGFSLNVKKNRAFVTAVEPNSIASRFFAIGDAFVDLDSVPIPVNGNTEFIKTYSPKFFKTGRITVVVERAVSPNARKMANFVMKFLISTATDSDVEMSNDAVAIGKQAALMHRMVLSKLTPRPILVGALKEPRTPETMERTVEDGGNNNNKRVNIANPKMLVTTIGSDVDEDESLRPVKKKSHAAETYDNFDD